MSSFDGPVGTLAARIMARANRAAEVEAIARLAPSPADTVLVIGFGPGVGVALLAERLESGKVTGVDPSAAMVRAATRANRAAVASGKVTLHPARADAVPAADGAFDGAVAVNSLQLCEPLAATGRELARVLKPGARLVSLTHDWALKRHAGSADGWIAMARAAFGEAGFDQIEVFPGEAEKGTIVTLTARRGSAPPR